MAPVRKKSVNKRFLGEVSPVKEVKNSTMARRKKFSKLGPQWTTKELHRFYKAYRLHGKSWKKIAAEVRNRSVEMVEALFNLNRAYLSLPEGTASVRGLVAMMTDHYSALGEVESEGEGDSSPELVQRPKKQKLDRIEHSTSKVDLNHFHPSASTNGCLSLLRKASLFGGQPRAVGKRTPRVPVSSLHNKDDNANSAFIKEKGQQSDVDGHVAALALTEASNRGYSPQGFQLLPRKQLSEEGFGSKDVNGDANVYPGTTEGVRTLGSLHKSKKFYGREVGAQENRTNLSDDEREACRGTEVKRCTTLLGSATTEVSSSKSNKSSRGGERKIYKKFLSGDEFPDLDALETLANISVRESESNFKLKERTSVDRNEKSYIAEASPSGHEKEAPVEDELLSSFQRVQGCSIKKQKFGRSSANSKPSPEAKQFLQSIHLNSSERKITNVASELQWSNPELLISSHQSKSLETEASNEDETKSSATAKRSDFSRQVKPTSAIDGALTAEPMKTSSCIDKSTEPSSLSNQVITSSGRRSRIKADMKRAIMHKEGRSFEKTLKNEFDKQLNSLSDRERHLEELSCCLSSPMFRRWCSYEWFYNAIDYPWFANKEFVEYLNHVGLGHIPRLTRVEWGVIRSSLGKPRRFSHRFLLEEREKLKQYRESVRTHYSELHNGSRDGLPRDLAKPLLVGQRVTALHPRIRELHDGSVLAVECGRCRLQFDCPQLGVELVEDINCMPLNPMDNMPEALRAQCLQVREHSKSSLASSSENGPSPLQMIVNQPQVEILGVRKNGMEVDKLHSVPQTEAAGADVVTTQEGFSCQNLIARVSPKEADRETFPGLTCSYDEQASPVPPSSRQYNFHSGFILPPLLKPASSPIYVCGTPSYSKNSVHFQEPESMANDIIRTSRSKAGAMVDTAVHAFSCGDKGEDPYLRTRKALDSVDCSKSQAEPRVPFVGSADDANSNSYSHTQPNHDSFEPYVNADRHGLESPNGSDRFEALIPSELISSCVATLLTIQTCSQRRYPHADVAQALESALASLHPSCPQNLALYRDIQMSMGRIKMQILSMVPT